MGNYEQLKEAIKAVIKTNGKQEITGQVMQDTLLAITSSFGQGALFAGIATPETNPLIPDQNVFYLASQSGVYPNFNGLSVANGEIAVFSLSAGQWTKQILSLGGGGSVTIINEPDEEDLTTVLQTAEKNVIRFKNRAYDEANASGKGYKILRKYWKTVDGVRKNILTQDIINDANTIYEIRYDFDLNGAEIQIKEGCVLNFVGGSLSSGTVEFNNTKIESNANASIFKNISFKGNASNEELYVSQFSYGVYGDCLDNAISWLKTQDIKLKTKIITLNRDIDFKSVIVDFWEVQLNGHTIKLGGGNRFISNIPSRMSKSYNQKIEIIGSNGKIDSSKVIIENCFGIKLYIGFFDNDVIFQTNTENTAIAYSEFDFVHVEGLIFRNTDNYDAGWINENRFVLQRSLRFIVEDSLKYFDHNVIYGGCFEGGYEIRLETGIKNIFKDIRNETDRRVLNGKLYFGEKTQSNIYYGSETKSGYIYDYGVGNAIILNTITFTKNIFNDNISFEDVKENRLGRFKNIKVSDSGTGIVIDKNTSVQEMYESPFLRLDNVLYGIMEVSSKLEPGIGIGYEVFNENFEPITFTESVSFGLLTTNDSTYKDGVEGAYLTNTSSYILNHGDSVQNDFVSNKYLVLKVFPINISNITNEGNVALAKTVKYVKFKIGTNPFFGNIINTEFMFINFNVFSYDVKEYPYQTDIKQIL